jgi:hypothetical protein
MPERFVTVGDFHNAHEAHMARNKLEEEGIRAFLHEGESASLLPLGMLGSSFKVQVLEGEAPRAAGILAACLADVAPMGGTSDEDAEEPIWLCPLCGEQVRIRFAECPGCHTTRGDIQAVEPGYVWPRRGGARRRGRTAPVPPRDAVTTQAAPAAPSESEPKPLEHVVRPVETESAADRASRAVRSALFGLIYVLLTLVAYWLLLHLLWPRH